jgi:hypothetical protein
LKGTFDDTELRIYGLAIEKVPQAIIAKTLSISTSKVSRTISKLRGEDYLREEIDKGVKIYKKGEKSKILDRLIANRQLQIDARSVMPIAPNADQNLIIVHHLLYRLSVVKEGALDRIVEVDDKGREVPHRFLQPESKYHNREVFKGQVPYADEWVTVKYERTAKRRYLYVYIPEIRQTPEEVRAKKWDEMAKTVCMDISKYVQRWGGWQLGLPEIVEKWKPHFAFRSQVFKNFSDLMFTKSQDGQVWLSDSEGTTELEASDPEIGALLVELPGQVIRISMDMKEVKTALMAMSDAIMASRKLNEELTTELIQAKAKLAQIEVESVKEKIPRDSAIAKLGDDSDNGVMYQ